MTRRIPWVHVVLFVLTFLSTLGAGAVQAGVNPLTDPLGIVLGLPFSLTLMIILLSHELGHYFTSKVHHTNATLPYFIPAPSIIGTFGAFIKMRSPIQTRRALVDIGASGPIIGFAFSVIACIAGLSMSHIVPLNGDVGAISLGDSLLFRFLADTILGTPPEGYDIVLHPVAFAGWIGLFVTSLNLIPIGQLDGGHVLFAFGGPLHRKVSKILSVALLIMGGPGLAVLLMQAFFNMDITFLGNISDFSWAGWGIWGILMQILGLYHPPVIYWERPLPRSRRIVGVTAFIIFIITFMPVPFHFSI